MKREILASRMLDARRSILADAQVLSERFGVPMPQMQNAKDPLVQALFELEAAAGFLSTLAESEASAEVPDDIEERLLEIDGIGPRTLSRIMEAIR